jgi:hypothetical protein
MTLYWAAWLLVGFGVPEGIALFTGHGENTLSETVWRWCDVLPGQTIWQWKAVHFFLLVFMIWLTLHLVLRIFR